MTTATTPKHPLVRGMWLTCMAMACGAIDIAQAGPDIGVEPADGSGNAPLPARNSSNHVTLGAGVAVRPHFLGSDGYQGEPAPLLDVQWGRFFAKSGEGLGVNVLQTEKFRAGVSFNWIQGYDEDEAPRGLEETKDAFGARLFASVRLKGVVATLAGTKAVTETERGLLVNATFAYPIALSERFAIVPSVGASWADEDYMVSYFGVDPSEARASGFVPYQPESGLRDASFRLAANFVITEKLSAVAFVGVTHLLGDAADSPIVEKGTQPLGLIGITYTF